MRIANVRDAAHRSIDRLPMSASCGDACNEMAVRREIQGGSRRLRD
jgi:hypothetical protein